MSVSMSGGDSRVVEMLFDGRITGTNLPGEFALVFCLLY